MRIDSALKAFHNSIMLTPFRDPLQHAYSLLNQYKLFTKKQSEDSSVNHYMTWLGHFEFGISHKRIKFYHSSFAHKNVESNDYSLEEWCDVHEYLSQEAEKYPGNLIFVSYELFCSNTDDVWHAFQDALELGDTTVPVIEEKRKEVRPSSDTILMNRAYQIYQRLSEVSKDKLLQ